jgi:hypothetical protein
MKKQKTIWVGMEYYLLLVIVGPRPSF